MPIPKPRRVTKMRPLKTGQDKFKQPKRAPRPPPKQITARTLKKRRMQLVVVAVDADVARTRKSPTESGTTPTQRCFLRRALRRVTNNTAVVPRGQKRKPPAAKLPIKPRRVGRPGRPLNRLVEQRPLRPSVFVVGALTTLALARFGLIALLIGCPPLRQQSAIPLALLTTRLTRPKRS